MNAKDFARLFGGFATEKRVRLIRALLDAGPSGLSLLELSRKTELSVIDIGITAEALLLLDLIDVEIKGENKVLTANSQLVRSVFEKSYYAFGSGRDKPHEPEADADAEAESLIDTDSATGEASAAQSGAEAEQAAP
ncbi:MAG: hypothetical protein ACKOAO_02055 [Oxalobacteraceae bacterium]